MAKINLPEDLLEKEAFKTLPAKEKEEYVSKGKKGESYEDVIKKMLKPEFEKEFEGSKSSSDLVEEA